MIRLINKIISNIGLPEQPNIEEFKRVCATTNEYEERHKIHAITLLSALLDTEEDAFELNRRLKFSVYERELAKFLVINKKISKNMDELL